MISLTVTGATHQSGAKAKNVFQSELSPCDVVLNVVSFEVKATADGFEISHQPFLIENHKDYGSHDFAAVLVYNDVDFWRTYYTYFYVEGLRKDFNIGFVGKLNDVNTHYRYRVNC